MRAGQYQIELANRIDGGRSVGNRWIVTQRPIGRTCQLFEAGTRDACAAFISDRVAADYEARRATRHDLMAAERLLDRAIRAEHGEGA